MHTMNTILRFWGILMLSVCFGSTAACSLETHDTKNGKLTVYPVQHASFVMDWGEKTIYVDPVGSSEQYSSYKKPQLVLITHDHGDHLNVELLQTLVTPSTKMIVSQSVFDKLSDNLKKQAQVMKNDDKANVLEIPIQAVPMYNLTEERKRFHPKGLGNGYVVTLGGKRIYIAGDTEDIPEMRALQNIDIAFLCMNLPYTMTIEQAADVTLAFKPKICYPYHHRGSDVEHFKKMVEEKSDVVVTLLNWYP
jgi:L-ascorbate metabolism protein UlaG (beta-lactamase superfamily)